MPVQQAQANVITAKKSIAPAAITATATGTGVDLSGYLSATCIVSVGVRTDGTHALKLQDSPDNSAWTDVAAANLVGSFTADVVSNTPQKVGYIGGQQYLRAVSTVSGTTTGAVYGALILLGKPRSV